MKILTIIIFLSFCGTFLSCSHGDLQIENNFKNGTILHVEWGEYPITDRLQPGESSLRRKIDNSSYYYDINLPESYPIRFFLATDNDTICYETKKVFTIEQGKFTLITLNENTDKVQFNAELPIN